MLENLVRRGLQQESSGAAADLIPHFKDALRLIVADGITKIPSRAEDISWKYTPGDMDNGGLDYTIKDVLKNALLVQSYIHGMFGAYTIRFSPVDSDRLWCFPFDAEWMLENNPCEIPNHRPGEPLPPVQLVSEPMLVVSGLDGLSYGKKFTLWTPMQVVTPWTFGGEEADRLTDPGFEKGWQERFRAETERKEQKRRDMELEEEMKEEMEEEMKEEMEWMDKKGELEEEEMEEEQAMKEKVKKVKKTKKTKKTKAKKEGKVKGQGKKLRSGNIV
jgi:hypothetical protein